MQVVLCERDLHYGKLTYGVMSIRHSLTEKRNNLPFLVSFSNFQRHVPRTTNRFYADKLGIERTGRYDYISIRVGGIIIDIDK